MGGAWRSRGAGSDSRQWRVASSLVVRGGGPQGASGRPTAPSVEPEGVIRDLGTANCRTFSAWLLNEEPREIFALPLLAELRALDSWLAYASRSRLLSFVKLARTIRSCGPAIEATIERRQTNGIAESDNAWIGRIRANACGFYDPEAFITMI